MAALVLSIAVNPASLKAQCAPGTATPAPSAHAIIGLVTDKALKPIPDARVSVPKPRLETSTDKRGRFQFAGLPRGEYELLVRKIGFEPEHVTASIGDSGAVVRVCMAVAVSPLPAVISSASRLGLGGFVADRSHRPVPGAEVRIIGNGLRTSTDSAGAFFLGAKSGHYAVAVSKEGYGTQMLGVTIPADSGREIAVWLGAPPLNKNRYAAELDEMRWRAVESSHYAVRTSEDLARSGLDLQQQIFAAALGVGTMCPNGYHVVGQEYATAGNMPHKSEVALLEVTTQWPGRPGHRTGPPCANAVVWMKP